MRWIPVVACAAAVIAASSCTSSGLTPGVAAGATSPRSTHQRTASHYSGMRSSAPRPSTRPADSASPDSSTSTAAPSSQAGPAERALAAMNLAQRVGQLLMVDCPSSGVAASTVTSIRRYHAGSVILDGNSTLGVAGTATITKQLQSLAPRGVRLFVSTDQEGGLVQRMKGPGFVDIPSALVQGSRTPSELRASTRTWAGELRSAGINVDLAPVLDTVPAGSRSNPPIGDLDREYGHTPTRVASRGVAVAQALDAAGVAATVKHFPGLGRVTGNTDVASGVTDDVTTRHDAYLLPFAAAIKEHVRFVMVSTAIYARIDPGTPAIFSPTIVTGMLRHDLGFTGVIITDDIGAAKQVASVPAGIRAVKFIAAGGTMALTVAPATVPLMARRLIDRARSDAAFRQKVNAAALVVLRAKAAAGLLG